jgi:hypothetical protein
MLTKGPNGHHKKPAALAVGSSNDGMEEFRQAAIEWAKASEATRVFLILEPLSALTDTTAQPDEYYKRMREAFEKEAACRERYFKAVQAVLEARRNNGRVAAP